MKEENIDIKYKVFALNELSDEDRELISESVRATAMSYSPYSKFKVGCAVRLDNGEIITGANQENIAYPSGLCAERVALFNAGMKDANVKTIAISAKDENDNDATAYPCGACRQVMSETENLIAKQPIKILIQRKDKTVVQLDSVGNLLPLSFEF